MIDRIIESEWAYVWAYFIGNKIKMFFKFPKIILFVLNIKKITF